MSTNTTPTLTNSPEIPRSQTWNTNTDSRRCSDSNPKGGPLDSVNVIQEARIDTNLPRRDTLNTSPTLTNKEIPRTKTWRTSSIESGRRNANVDEEPNIG